MPDMDGCLLRLKSHPDTVFIPPIFVTAISNEQKYLSKAYDLGAIDFYLNLKHGNYTKKVASFLKIWDYDQELKKLNETLAQKNEELEQFAHMPMT
jgi:response regulator RpfG family c-di-GMP phosphodiesterase